jgi:CheY-like chemotaxis protein
MKNKLSHRILIVDDEPMITSTISMILELHAKASYETTCVNSPEEALDLIYSSRFNLLLTDFFMPGINGLQLVQKIRAAGHDMPVLMLTGYHNSKELDNHPHSLGHFDIVTKPWNNRHLLEVIQTMIAQYQSTSHPLNDLVAAP